MAKVVIIDDEPDTTTILEKMLENTDFEVFTEYSGSKGVDAVRRLEPDIVVLDLMMPGMSGWDVCRAIRAFSQVPILILSAVTRSDKVIRALDEGANDYLVKPVPRGVLISHIRNLIAQKDIPSTNNTI